MRLVASFSYLGRRRIKAVSRAAHFNSNPAIKMATDYLSPVSEALYQYGVDGISMLQLSFPDGEAFFMDVSKVFDPKYVFTVYFPFVYALQWAMGVQLLGTIIVVEWMNQVLKWLMRGDRPYWWIHEVESKNTSIILPDIHQYPSTCETGPGTPSGHSMAMSAVWYVIVDSIIDRLVKPSNISHVHKQRIAFSLWLVYAISQMLIMMSRMYIAAHFPHQCFLGVFLGISMAKIICSSSKWLSLRRNQWLLVASMILGSAVGTYSLLLLSGTDPAWSIARAFKWCAKREYIHVDTTPFYSLVRYSGSAFGLGLGLTSTFFYKTDRSRFGISKTVGTLVLGLILGNVADLTHVLIPKANELVFYVSEFILNVLLPYAVIGVVPYIVAIASTKQKKL